MSIKTKIASKLQGMNTKFAQMKMGKPNIEQATLRKMTHLSENVKKPSFASGMKAQNQVMKNQNAAYKASRLSPKPSVGKGSTGTRVGF